MKVKSFCVFFFMFSLVFATRSYGLEDCFNYQCTRQDQDFFKEAYGWEVIKAFDEKGKDNFIIEKRWPTANLTFTPEEERARFGTTGFELAQAYNPVWYHDGKNMRMFCYWRIVHRGGERKLIAWRAEFNPPMPKEYLNPSYPEEKKTGLDRQMILHWVHPSDIRGTSILINSYNNKEKDNDTWLWFPSLRKVRRLTPANGGDALAGSDFTFAEVLLLRITDETYQIIGETMYRGLVPVDYYEGLYLVDKYGPGKERVVFYKKISQPRDCWVIRTKSVRGGYGDWYDSRILILDKEWLSLYGWEIYDAQGKIMKSDWSMTKRVSDYNGNPMNSYVNATSEVLNFVDRGFTYTFGDQTNFGVPVPKSWFTLRELKKSIPTVLIPYMAVMPPKRLAPLKELYPPEILEARKKFFPERITDIPNPTACKGVDKFK